MHREAVFVLEARKGADEHFAVRIPIVNGEILRVKPGHLAFDCAILHAAPIGPCVLDYLVRALVWLAFDVPDFHLKPDAIRPYDITASHAEVFLERAVILG